MNSFRNKLIQCFDHELPGIEAQLGMAPAHREIEIRDLERRKTAVKSSVLILLYEKEGSPHIVFIRRPLYNGVHSGQIAFPGGRWETTDKSMYHTALRETREEIGIDISRLNYAGKLTDLYIPPSNYIVCPFVAWFEGNIKYNPDPIEVAGILEIPFAFFLQPSVIYNEMIPLSGGQTIVSPAFTFKGNIIWGATAMILHELVVLWKTTVK